MTCVECGRALYRPSTPPARRPDGAVLHAGHGLCHRDRIRRVKAGIDLGGPPTERSVHDRLVAPRPPADIDHAREALADYMRGRVRRLAEKHERERRLTAAQAAGLLAA